MPVYYDLYCVTSGAGHVINVGVFIKTHELAPPTPVNAEQFIHIKYVSCKAFSNSSPIQIEMRSTSGSASVPPASHSFALE